MRRTAAILAGLVAVGHLGTFLLTERLVQATLAGVGAVSVPVWLRGLWLVGASVPWAVGAVLLATGRLRSVVVVVLTAAAVLLADGLATLGPAIDLVRGDGAADVWAVLERVGGAVVWLLGVVAALTAWLVRPRGDWRVGAPGPVGWYVALAVLAWLPTVLRTTAVAPPGAPRRFVEWYAASLTGLDAVASLVGAVVVLGVLWLAPRRRRDLAGLMLLTYAVPAGLAATGSVYRVATGEHVIFTPAGVAGLVGLLGLVVTGVLWARWQPGTAGDTAPAATAPQP